MKYTYFLLLLLLVSCKPTHTEDTTSKTSSPKLTEPHIVFYFFKAINKEQVYAIKLIKTKRVKGKQKEIFTDTIPIEKLTTKNWLVSFRNNLKATVLQLQIPNPLVENIEYIDEQNNLAKKQINHQEKDFVVRIPYDKSINSVKFEALTQENHNVKTVFISEIDIK